MAGESQGYGSETRPPTEWDDGLKLFGNKQQNKSLTSLLERVKRQDLTGASPLRRLVEC